MKKTNWMKWALPALLMSAVTFEMLPGSVQYYAKDFVAAPEAAWNFFSPPVQSTAASCLSVAGVVTLVALVLALVSACFQKRLYQVTGWCALAAATLAAVPYMTATEEELLQPNVVVLLVLMASWLLALALDKKKDAQDQPESKGRRLKVKS